MSSTSRGRTAIVSGAGSGIGAAIAAELGARGFALALIGRRREALEASLRAAGGQGVALAADVRDADAVSEAVAEAAASLGSLEVAVAAAGVARVGDFVELGAEGLRESLATNLEGTANLFRSVVPGMRERGTGHLVPLLSVASRRGFPGWSAYCASKWGLLGWIEALREELRGSGIRISAITPGATQTPLWNDVPGEWDRAAMIPAREVARAVAWALESGAEVAVEEIRLQPPRGIL